MNIHDNILSLIGNTPLIRLHAVEKEHSIQGKIVAKVESFNPAGSAKDRVALNMLLDAEERGLISPGAVIIEPTSGNTGVGLAAVAAVKGYKVILTMPDTMSKERMLLLKAYGAELILTDGALGMAGSVAKAEELQRSIPGAFIPSQFTNPANPESHRTTAREIWKDTEGEIDIFIAGIGTGGTISGTGKYLKEYNPKIEIIGFEPASSPLITEGRAGGHKLQGIGANFIPETFNRDICDEIITVTDDDAMEYGRFLARKEGILAGITSGAAVCAAVAVAKRPENRFKTIVCLLPDSGERYLTTEMFYK